MTIPNRSERDFDTPSAAAWLPSLSIPTMSLVVLILVLKQPSAWLLWSIPTLLFVIVPVFDVILGCDDSNPSDLKIAQASSDVTHRMLPFLFVPIQWTVLGVSLAVASLPTLSWAEFSGLVLTVGAVNGLAIVAAHEIGHRAGKVAAAAARIALVPCCYGHFRIEHNRGHHRRVATLEDPASARLGEAFWRFLPRSVLGGLASAWRFEAARLKRHSLSAWSVHNECLQSHANTLVLLGTVGCFGGGRIVLFVMLQAASAISLLEAINYLEHYGLKRQVVAGKLEICGSRHSWNCASKLTNRLMFNLQRHSDHHVHPARRYERLRTDPSYPRLPAGYAALLWVVYVPPLWSWLMDRRVLSCYAGELALANVHPPAFEALRRKWSNSMVSSGAGALAEAPLQQAAAQRSEPCPERMTVEINSK